MLTTDVLLSWNLAYGVAGAVLIGVLLPTLLRLRLDVPGPSLARFTNMWYWWQMKRGNFQVTNLELHNKSGPIVQIAPEYFSISDPSALKTIYGHGTKFEKAPWYSVWTSGKAKTNLFIEKSSSVHGALRRKVASMYSMSSLVSYEPFVDNCIALFKSRLREKAISGELLDLAAWLQFYAFDVIGEITYGRQFGFLDKGSDIDGMMDSLDQILWFQTYLGLFLWLKPIGKYLFSLGSSSQNFFASFIIKNIAEAKKTADDADEHISMSMTTKLVKAQRKDPGSLSDTELLMYTAGNIGAGSDTTAIGLSSVVYYLYRSPRVLRKLREELDAANLSPRPAFKDVQKLPYLQAVLNESMRLHPGVGLPLFRTVPAGGAEVAGKFFPAGVHLGVNAWVLHQNPDIFGANPAEFRPERWIDADENQARAMQQNFMSFGLGSRTCIGKNISLLEMNKLIPVLVQEFDFEFTPEVEKSWTVNNKWFVKPVGFQGRVRQRTDMAKV
ncbi:hypothetical protein SEUCBS139899_004636 [Sporothrix eucalyptigena]|uniref:Cytochrome P450 n=1 Tax=Sporothrix eucalyptigena TaxID=1812306 RepID=A0ABP0BPB0_9PEZI